MKVLNNLVFIKNQDVFTNSMVIANETGNQHHSVTRLIRNRPDIFTSLGVLRFMDFKSRNSKGGRPMRVYELNLSI